MNIIKLVYNSNREHDYYCVHYYYIIHRNCHYNVEVGPGNWTSE